MVVVLKRFSGFNMLLFADLKSVFRDHQGEVGWTLVTIALAEFVGTALLIFFTCLSSLVGMSQDPPVPLQVALCSGLTVAIIIQLVMTSPRGPRWATWVRALGSHAAPKAEFLTFADAGVTLKEGPTREERDFSSASLRKLSTGRLFPTDDSAAHLNPAVSIAAVVLEQINIPLAIVYIVSECSGAIVGFGLLKALLPGRIMSEASPNGTCCEMCVTKPHQDLTLLQAVIMEGVVTATLILTVCATWDARNENKQDSIPLKFGFLVTTVAAVELAFLVNSLWCTTRKPLPQLLDKTSAKAGPWKQVPAGPILPITDLSLVTPPDS
uniref:Uncharacterized protein n=1 Tax=Timema tahoe TaxID=61484 RepID=A0A7R9ISS0_9NEOP|nr:unnamed protein product [Timema tahoe]